jgi:hypothetical protein
MDRNRFIGNIVIYGIVLSGFYCIYIKENKLCKWQKVHSKRLFIFYAILS